MGCELRHESKRWSWLVYTHTHTCKHKQQQTQTTTTATTKRTLVSVAVSVAERDDERKATLDCCGTNAMADPAVRKKVAVESFMMIGLFVDIVEEEGE